MTETCLVDVTRSCVLHENGIQADTLVTKESCVEKHKWSVWAFGVLFALMSLFFALAGVALASSNSTSSRVGEIQVKMTSQIADSDKTLEVHMVRQEESNKALLSTLSAMQRSIDANTETLRTQSEQISIQNRILEKMLEKSE